MKEVDNYLANLPNWQRAYLETFRSLFHEVEPETIEEWKWSVPVFVVNGKLVCAISSFKDHAKFNFFFGALLNDEHKLFNNGLDSEKHRSIDLKEGDSIDEKMLKDLIAEAIEKVK